MWCQSLDLLHHVSRCFTMCQDLLVWILPIFKDASIHTTLLTCCYDDVPWLAITCLVLFLAKSKDFKSQKNFKAENGENGENGWLRKNVEPELPRESTSNLKVKHPERTWDTSKRRHVDTATGLRKAKGDALTFGAQTAPKNTSIQLYSIDTLYIHCTATHVISVTVPCHIMSYLSSHVRTVWNCKCALPSNALFANTSGPFRAVVQVVQVVCKRFCANLEWLTSHHHVISCHGDNNILTYSKVIGKKKSAIFWLCFIELHFMFLSRVSFGSCVFFPRSVRISPYSNSM